MFTWEKWWKNLNFCFSLKKCMKKTFCCFSFCHKYINHWMKSSWEKYVYNIYICNAYSCIIYNKNRDYIMKRDKNAVDAYIKIEILCIILKSLPCFVFLVAQNLPSTFVACLWVSYELLRMPLLLFFDLITCLLDFFSFFYSLKIELNCFFKFFLFLLKLILCFREFLSPLSLFFLISRKICVLVSSYKIFFKFNWTFFFILFF